MAEQPLKGKVVLVTGGARRLGRLFSLACAREGANVIIHHAHSDPDAEDLRAEIIEIGRVAWIFKSDLSNPSQAQNLIPLINDLTPIHHLINSAAIFEPHTFDSTTVDAWSRHLALNLTAPFLLSQAFSRQAGNGARIINILDWRAMRPGADHFPYTVSKAALAGMTKSMAVALAPRITVNGLALGAVLPPSDGNGKPDIRKPIPMERWAKEGEAEETLLFLLTCPEYITGEILHLDGGIHLV